MVSLRRPELVAITPAHSWAWLWAAAVLGGTEVPVAAGLGLIRDRWSGPAGRPGERSRPAGRPGRGV